MEVHVEVQVEGHVEVQVEVEVKSAGSKVLLVPWKFVSVLLMLVAWRQPARFVKMTPTSPARRSPQANSASAPWYLLSDTSLVSAPVKNALLHALPIGPARRCSREAEKSCNSQRRRILHQLTVAPR